MPRNVASIVFPPSSLADRRADAHHGVRNGTPVTAAPSRVEQPAFRPGLSPRYPLDLAAHTDAQTPHHHHRVAAACAVQGTFVIVSHQHKFIFLKTLKTAGTSVEIALSKHCGPDDIITPVSPADEKLRKKMGGRGPQNYQRPGKPNAYHHMRARRVRQLVGKEVWQSYFKFTIERNPWDAVVSSYAYVTRNREEVSFEEFVDTMLDGLAKNSRIYRIGQRIVVDKVCLYENLQQELEQVWKQLGLPGPVELPLAKSGFRDESKHYREMYTPEQAVKICQLYSDVIEAFGYEF